MDARILVTQNWLNTTYGSVAGWVRVDENGLTGWETIYALRRGLQAELGITPVTSGFGPATTAAFTSKIRSINPTSSTPANVLRLLSGAMWCKGYQGLVDDDAQHPPTFSAMAPYVGQVRSDLGLGSANPFVDVKLMASLMSMDAYVIPVFGGGTSSVREVQRWFNGMYLARRDFAVVPCDGIFSRQVQTALLFALQYEFGMADGTANGNFGPGTQSGLKSKAPVGPGSVDTSSKRFVHLYQAAMRFNRYVVPFSGTFDSTTSARSSDFQAFMEIPVTGKGDYTTWANLLVSSGDTSIKTKGFDTNRQLTATQAAGAKAAGYTHVGRYTVGADKFITSGELDALRSAGLRLIPLHQRFNDSAATMTRTAGRTQGLEALERCRVLGLPSGSLVFFSVDFDPIGETIDGPVMDFFRGVNDVMGSALNGTYKVGAYGTRNVCQTLLDTKQVEGAFVAGMSTGYSGNMGFPMPNGWHYNQIVEVTETLGGTPLGVDHDVVSSRATPVDLASVVSPPIERDGTTTATGFDVPFEWICRAEVAAERALNASTRTLKVNIPTYILHWLRRPEYWSPAWQAYTPLTDGGDQLATTARGYVDGALSVLSPTKPAVSSSVRDVPHFAVSTLAYLAYGVPTTVDNYGLGDLGGWALDLYSVFGVWSYLTTQPDLATYMASNIGTAFGKFSVPDIVADADAWLLAKSLKDVPGRTLSSALRGIWRLTPGQRIKKFYADRFDSSADNIAKAFPKLTDGVDAGSVNFAWTDNVIRAQAKAKRAASTAEAVICGRALGQALARLGS